MQWLSHLKLSFWKDSEDQDTDSTPSNYISSFWEYNFHPFFHLWNLKIFHLWYEMKISNFLSEKIRKTKILIRPHCKNLYSFFPSKWSTTMDLRIILFPKGRNIIWWGRISILVFRIFSERKFEMGKPLRNLATKKFLPNLASPKCWYRSVEAFNESSRSRKGYDGSLWRDWI